MSIRLGFHIGPFSLSGGGRHYYRRRRYPRRYRVVKPQPRRYAYWSLPPAGSRSPDDPNRIIWSGKAPWS